MAVTKTQKLPQQAAAIGGLRVRIIDLALALNDYVTGGIAVAAHEVGLSEIYGVAVIGQDAAVKGYLPVWDEPNQKLMLFQNVNPAAAGGADVVFNEVGNGSSVACTFKLLIIGV